MHNAMQNTAIPVPGTLNVRGRLVNLSTPKVMGILNVTPDSFYEGSRHVTEKDIVQHAEKMLAHGATFLDIGGYSSRPGADDIGEEEELRGVAGGFLRTRGGRSGGGAGGRSPFHARVELGWDRCFR